MPVRVRQRVPRLLGSLNYSNPAACGFVCLSAFYNQIAAINGNRVRKRFRPSWIDWRRRPDKPPRFAGIVKFGENPYCVSHYGDIL